MRKQVVVLTLTYPEDSLGLDIRQVLDSLQHFLRSRGYHRFLASWGRKRKTNSFPGKRAVTLEDVTPREDSNVILLNVPVEYVVVEEDGLGMRLRTSKCLACGAEGCSIGHGRRYRVNASDAQQYYKYLQHKRNCPMNAFVDDRGRLIKSKAKDVVGNLG